MTNDQASMTNGGYAEIVIFGHWYLVIGH
jgi:hypothetical protein